MTNHILIEHRPVLNLLSKQKLIHAGILDDLGSFEDWSSEVSFSKHRTASNMESYTYTIAWLGLDSTKYHTIKGQFDIEFGHRNNDEYTKISYVPSGVKSIKNKSLSGENDLLSHFLNWLDILKRMSVSVEEADAISESTRAYEKFVDEINDRFKDFESKSATKEDLDAAFDLISEMEKRISELENSGKINKSEAIDALNRTKEAKENISTSTNKKKAFGAVLKLWYWMSHFTRFGVKVLQNENIASATTAV
mgnify:CR=1 FL=1